jgi:hypothetical protein
MTSVYVDKEQIRTLNGIAFPTVRSKFVSEKDIDT